MRQELLLGCGTSRVKRMAPPGGSREWVGLITLDIDPSLRPDILCELNSWTVLNNTTVGAAALNNNTRYRDLPDLQNDFFDEIHAYEVLEHLGLQGDYVKFFVDFHMIWRLLKPNGFLCATVPSRFGPWLWGDPGHRRAILPESLTFLDRTNYAQLGHTAMSDYRACWSGDFRIVSSEDNKITHSFVLQAVKPAREY